MKFAVLQREVVVGTITRHSKWRLKAGCFLCIVFVLILGYLVYLRFYPFDEVVVEVRDVPEDTAFFCLIADRPAGLELMPWSITKVYPSTMPPDRCIVSYRLGRETGPHHGMIRWKSGERVGVLLGSNSGRWQIAWFSGENCRVNERSWMFGGGSWRPTLHDAASEQTLDEGALRVLGLDYALRKEK